MKALHDQYKVLNEKTLFQLNGGYGTGSGVSSKTPTCPSGYSSPSAYCGPYKVLWNWNVR